MKRVFVAMTLVIVAAIAFAPASFAHVPRKVDGLDLELGWASEPPLSGQVNAVQVFVRQGGSAVSTADLKVTASVAGKTSDALDAEPVDESPGEYLATLIPTAVGAYTFHLTGTAGGKKIDQLFTPKEGIEEVVGTSAYSFPNSPPSNSELASSLADLKDAQDSDKSTQRTIMIVAIAGLALAVIGLLMSRRKA